MRKLAYLFAVCCWVILSPVTAAPDQTLTLTRVNCQIVQQFNEIEKYCHWETTGKPLAPRALITRPHTRVKRGPVVPVPAALADATIRGSDAQQPFAASRL